MSAPYNLEYFGLIECELCDTIAKSLYCEECDESNHCEYCGESDSCEIVLDTL